MKCSICGQESVPGAKLCADCRAARKRAFAATVTQPLLDAAGTRRSRSSARLLKPSQSIAATARRAARKANKEAAVQPSTVVPARRRWLPVAMIVLALTLIAGAYGAHRLRGVDASDVSPRADGDAGAAKAAAEPIAAPVQGPNIAAQPENAMPKSDLVTPPPAPPVPTKKPGARAKAVILPEVVATPPPEPLPQTVAPAPVEPPVEVKPAPRVDPWQPLNDAMVGCAREDFATRLRCVQSARVRYCEGNWGVAAQCPIGPNTDHGQ